MKLTRENFLYWQTQVLPSLRGARVMGLLDGSDAAPPKFLEVEDEHKKKTTVPNPAFDVWIAKDQQVVGFLVNSLSEDVLAHVFGLEHAADVWKALNDLYGSQSKSRVSSLRGAMTNTNKLDLTAQQYISKMKGFASELAAAGKKVYDEELKDYILNGLDANFNSLVAAINVVPSTTLNDMCSQVLACEHRDNMLQSTGEAPGSFTSSVNAAPRRPSFDTHSVPARPPLLPPLPNTPPCTTTLRSLCIHPIIPISICPCLSITCHNQNNLWCLNLPTCLHHTTTSLHSSSIARPATTSSPTTPVPPATATPVPRGPGRRPKGGRGKKDRVATQWQEGVMCQICKKEGHSTNECWWRYGDDDDDAPADKKVLMVSIQIGMWTQGQQIMSLDS
jgi:hypothetical protein